MAPPAVDPAGELPIYIATAVSQRHTTMGGHQKHVAQYTATGVLTLDDHVVTFAPGAGGPHTLNLPAAPIAGQEFWIKVVSNVGPAGHNVSGNGKYILGAPGAPPASSLPLDTVGASYHLVWSQNDALWLLLGTL